MEKTLSMRSSLDLGNENGQRVWLFIPVPLFTTDGRCECGLRARLYIFFSSLNTQLKSVHSDLKDAGAKSLNAVPL